MQTVSSNENLRTYFLTGSQSKSVSVFDSDAIGNLLHMEALVATLIKYGNSGQYIPYLATRWEVNEKKTIFRFIFESEHYDESGDLITPFKFSNCLHQLLKEYSKKSDPPVFSDLVGWNDFKYGKTPTVAGIVTDDKFIEFRFSLSMSGVLEFLSMPYYGYYNKDNFNIDGSWKDSKKIIASGHYYLKDFDSNSISLSLRKQYFSSQEKGFKNITIYVNPESQNNYSESSIGPNLIVLDNKANFSTQTGKTLKPTPTILALVEINNKSKQIKENSYIKEFLYENLTKIRQQYISEDDFISRSEGFFKKFEDPVLVKNSSLPKKIKIKIHKIENAKSSAYLYLLDLLKVQLEKIPTIETEFYLSPSKPTIIVTQPH